MNKLVGIILFVLSSITFAGDITSIDQTRKLSDQMMEKFTKKEFDNALAIAKPNWPLPAVEIDVMSNQIKTQWPIIDQRFGKTTGYEFIREERIGTSFIRYYYLHKFENHAIYWKFTFYKPENRWLVNGVEFLDSLDVLYERVK